MSSATIAVALALGNVVWLRTAEGIGRIRDLQVLVLLRKALDTADFHLLAVLPAALNKAVDLHSFSNVIWFFGVSAIVYLAMMTAVAALASPLVALVARWFPASSRSGVWLWERAYPIGTLAVLAAPAVLGPLHRLFNTGGDPRVSIVATVAIVTAVWLVLAAVVRRPQAINRFLTVCAASSIAVAMVAALGSVVLAALGAIGDPQRQAAPAPGLPNVLLVSIDSLRRDHLRCYGYERETSPTIDGLAAEGARFKTVVAPSPWTLPSHVTMLTSLPPEQHGVIESDRRLAPETMTLAQVLWDAGYSTAGFVGGAFLDAMYGYAKGFDHYDDYTVVKSFEPASHHGVTSPRLTQLTESWLEDWKAEGGRRPFFVFLHLWDVHYDYTPPPPYDTMFDPTYRGAITGEDFETGAQVHAGMDPSDLAHIVALYDGEIRFTDVYLGRVLQVLKQLGVLDNTIVVVTADHGEEFFEHGMKGHAKQLYDETILVPLLVRFPKKVPAGIVVPAQVRLMDIAPTILSLAGLPVPKGYGTPDPKGKYAERDLSSLLVADSKEAAVPVVAFSDLRGRMGALRTEQSKLITKLERGESELYDLSTDPGERVNKIGRDPAVDGALQHELLAWREGSAGAAQSAQRIELSEDHKERLRALGYIR